MVKDSKLRGVFGLILCLSNSTATCNMNRLCPLRNFFMRTITLSSSPDPCSELVSIIKDYARFNEDIIRSYVENDMKIQAMSKSKVEFSCNLVKRLEIKTASISDFLDLVKAHPVTVENRALVLLESGFKTDTISSKVVSKYLTVVKNKVRLLKKKGFINEETCVVDQLLRAADLDPSSLKEYPDDESTLIKIKGLVVTTYLAKMLDFPEDFEIQEGALFRLNHKSLENTRESLKIALDEIGFTKKKVRNNPYILYAHPANTRDILDRVPNLCGTPMTSILRLHPKIISSTSENILESLDHFKRFGIPEIAIYKCPEIFTLKSSTILERLEALKKIQFLSMRMNHPRILDTVFYYKKVCRRLKLIEENKLAYASINIIATTEKKFEKFFEEGNEKPRGSDIIMFLQKELNFSRPSIRERLNRHPYWPYLPLVDIGNTLNLLRSYGFSDEDIVENIYILFYPAHKVAKELDAIRSNKDDQGSLSSIKSGFNYEIQLALYELEKVFNFTGEAVWSEQVSVPDTAKD